MESETQETATKKGNRRYKVRPRDRGGDKSRRRQLILVQGDKRVTLAIGTASRRERALAQGRVDERAFLQMLSSAVAPQQATHTWRALFAAIEKVHDDTQDAFAARLLHACADLLGRIGRDGQLDVLAAPNSIAALLRLLETPEARTALHESDPLAPARVRWLHDQQRLLQAEGGTLTMSQLADALGITREGVRQRGNRGALLSLPVGNALYFPVWQFQDQRHYATLPGLRNVLAALPDDAWGKAIFLLGGEPSLGGERPIDYLRRGDIAPVLVAARVYGRQGAQ